MSSSGSLSNRFAVYTGTGRIVAMLLSFAMPLFLTRYLSRADYGLYSQFYTFLGFYGSIAAFGIQSNLYYFLPRHACRKTVIGNTFAAMLVIASLTFGLFRIPAVSGILVSGEGLREHSMLLGICIMLYAPALIVTPLFVLKGDKLLSVIFPPLEIILKVALIVGASLIFGNLKAIFIAITILQAAIFAFAAIYSLSEGLSEKGPWLDWALLRKQLSYAIPFGLSAVMATLFHQFDKVLCAAYVTPEQYALYALSFFGIPGIQQVYDSVCEVNLLNMTKLHKEGDIPGVLSQYREFCTKMLSFTVPLVTIVFVFADDIIITLFSDKYAGSVPYFRVYILSFIFSTIGAGTVLRATGNTGKTFRAYLYSSFIYLPAAFIGIRYWGLKGAMISAMLGVILPKLFQMYFDTRVLKVSVSKYLPWMRILTIFIVSAASGAAALTAKRIIGGNIICDAAIAVFCLSLAFLAEMRFRLFIVGPGFLRRNRA